jgi:hypothetical protein
MHKDDLRPATRKKAEISHKKLGKRLSSGEKKSSKRMATVASVYNIERFIRSPESFKNELTTVKVVDEIKRPKPIAKRVWASVEKSPETVVKEMFEEGLRRDPENKKMWVVLVDGAPSQISLIKAEAKARKIPITIVCRILPNVVRLLKVQQLFQSSRE